VADRFIELPLGVGQLRQFESGIIGPVGLRVLDRHPLEVEPLVLHRRSDQGDGMQRFRIECAGGRRGIEHPTRDRPGRVSQSFSGQPHRLRQSRVGLGPERTGQSGEGDQSNDGATHQAASGTAGAREMTRSVMMPCSLEIVVPFRAWSAASAACRAARIRGAGQRGAAAAHAWALAS